MSPQLFKWNIKINNLLPHLNQSSAKMLKEFSSKYNSLYAEKKIKFLSKGCCIYRKFDIKVVE